MSFLKNFLQPCSTEGPQQQQSDTKAVLSRKGLGTGTLCIAESHLTWSNGSGLGFLMKYPVISFMCICISGWGGGEEEKEGGEGGERGGGGEGSDDVEPIAQFRSVLSDKPTSEAIFAAMCECQALHPDPEGEDSDGHHGEEYDVEAQGIERGTTPTIGAQFEYADVDH
uniref:Methylosome subunit pICln n=1 Tax=Felis catus TaxID=9685 RepID=A0ABI7WZX0_FELCA